MTCILETRSLNKEFGAVIAAKDLNVQINKGEVVGVIGSNGAGKTTFINMVTGYLKPTRGEILFNGKSIMGHSPRAITRAGMARSFQVAQLFRAGCCRKRPSEFPKPPAQRCPYCQG